jgi:hypothetical protein
VQDIVQRNRDTLLTLQNDFIIIINYLNICPALKNYIFYTRNEVPNVVSGEIVKSKKYYRIDSIYLFIHHAGSKSSFSAMEVQDAPFFMNLNGFKNPNGESSSENHRGRLKKGGKYISGGSTVCDSSEGDVNKGGRSETDYEGSEDGDNESEGSEGGGRGSGSGGEGSEGGDKESEGSEGGGRGSGGEGSEGGDQESEGSEGGGSGSGSSGGGSSGGIPRQN